MVTKAKKAAEPKVETKQGSGTEIVKVIEEKVTAAVEVVGKITIKTEPEFLAASEQLSNVKKLQKFITQEKEKILKPLREATSAARGMFAPLEDRAEQAENTLKRVMGAYHDKMEAENKRKADAIAARAQKEGPGSLTPEVAVKKMEELGQVKSNVKTEAGATTFSKVKKVRVTDPTKVPDEYWIIDEVTLRSAALTKAKTENRIGEVLPGVEVYEETIVGGRA